MSKIINKIVFGFGLFALVLFASAASAITNTLPQIQAVYGGSIRAIDIIEPVGTISNVRVFVSTEFSANSIFYADVDHSLDPAVKYSTNNFRFRVIPDFNAQANFGAVNDIAGHEDSGRLFVADNNLLSCNTNVGSLVTNISLSAYPGSQFLAVTIYESNLVALASVNNSVVLYFGALDASGNFSQGSGSPINVGLSGINNSSDIDFSVNPSNSCVYVFASSGTHGILKSSSPCASLSGSTTFSTIDLPAEVSSWQGNKRLGFGPEGRMFVGGSSASNYKMITYSDNDGGAWTAVSTGVGGTTGNNIHTSHQTNLYGVIFGGAVSTNKGETGSWRNIGYDAGPFSGHANDSAAFYDPVMDRRSFYCSSDQGIACSTNGGATIFEIDYGLEAVAIQDLDMNEAKTLAWTASKSGLRRGTGVPMALEWTPDGTFPTGDGSPYYSIAIDKGDTSGNTVYAGNGNVYKSADGGTNWTRIWASEGNTNGFPNNGYFATLAANDRVVVAGFYSGSGAGGLLISQDGGSNWMQGIASVDVNDVLLYTTNSVLIAAAYNATSGKGGIYNQSASGQVRELTDNVSIRSFAADSAGGVYACGQATDYAIKIYYKSLSDSSWTEVTTNGLSAQNQLVSGRGPVMTVGRDSSSNDLPIIIMGHSLYYLQAGASTWQTSSALTYPDGSTINVLYWDELMVGTSEGLYGQGINTQPVTVTLADPAIVDSAGNWYIWFSGSGYQRGGPWSLGISGGTPLAADFDGDFYADPAIVDSAGNWYIWFTSRSYQRGGPWSLGISDGTPVAADFDGDFYADPAVVDSAGAWSIWFTSRSYQRGGPYNLGVSDGTPIAADFDGDLYADPAVVSTTGGWSIWFTSRSYQRGGPYNLGVSDGAPLAADFDGDLYADPAVVDNAGNWYIWFTSRGYQRGGPWSLGISGTPLAADFDGR